MTFSEELWEHTLPIFREIIAHPFNVELAEGTLRADRFRFYMEQDECYLVDFSRALALIAGRSSYVGPFLHFASGAFHAERMLHAHFLAPGSYDHIEPSPACMAYTRFLLATAATASVEEAIAAVLPCFWIYREVGRTIAKRAHRDNPYALWIETYSSREFSEETEQAIALLDAVAEQSPPHLLKRMTSAFEYCTLFEWHFWNDAYKMAVFNCSVITADSAIGLEASLTFQVSGRGGLL